MYHGQPGVITGWTSTGKSARVLFDHKKSAVDIQAKMLVALPPSPSPSGMSTSTSIPTVQSFEDVKIPTGSSVPAGRFVQFSEAEYRAAFIAQSLADPDNEDFSTTLDVVIDAAFINVGFGSGEASVAFFRKKLEEAQDDYVAQAKDQDLV